METLEILSDPGLMARIRTAQDELAAGLGIPLEDVIADVRSAGKNV